MTAGGGPPSLDRVMFGPRSPYVFPSADRIWTTGVNWYLNRFLQLSLNINQEHRSPAIGMSPQPGTIWTRTFRVEFGL
jgi:phosphate-selective porin